MKNYYHIVQADIITLLKSCLETDISFRVNLPDYNILIPPIDSALSMYDYLNYQYYI